MVFERFYFADIPQVTFKYGQIKRRNSSEGDSPRMSENAISLFITNHKASFIEIKASGIESIMSDAINECSPFLPAAISPASPCM